jgi:hypothetical protein
VFVPRLRKTKSPITAFVTQVAAAVAYAKLQDAAPIVMFPMLTQCWQVYDLPLVKGVLDDPVTIDIASVFNKGVVIDVETFNEQFRVAVLVVMFGRTKFTVPVFIV